MRSRALAAAPLLAASLCACTSKDPSFPVEVLFSRCARVLQGPVCELKPDRVVALWVGSATLSFEVSGREVSRAQSTDGVRVETVVPEGATEVVVKTARARPFKLAVASPPGVPALERAIALKAEGKLADARAVLDELDDAAGSAVTLRKRSLVARLSLAEGRVADAVALLQSTLREHERAGHVSEALLDGEALAWALLQQGGRLTEARDALTSLERAALVDPEGAALLAYYQAMVFSETGDVRSALELLRISEARARRLDAAELLVSIEQLRALQLDALGRHDEAHARLRDLERRPLPPCLLANLSTNLGWTALRAGRATAEARAALERAATLFSSACPRPNDHANALENLALAALLSGDLAAAEVSLASSRAVSADEPRLELWRLDLDGRLQLARQRPKAAVDSFRRLQALAEAGFVPEAAWRAAVGQARAALQLGQPAVALEAFRRAEALLDDEYRRLPLGEGLHSLLSDRERATGEYLELLVKSGRVEEALRCARHARTRALRHLAATERLSRLEPARRERWERAVSSHAAARARLDEAAHADWQLPADQLEAVRAARHRDEVALSAALDAALAELEPPSDALRPVGADELLLVVAPGARDWLLFAATDDEVTVTPVELPPQGAPTLSATVLRAAVGRRLGAVREVSWLPWGAWNAVDPRLASLEGEPLGASRAVSWRVDVPARRAGSPPAGTLLVADPTRNLPGARLEAARVRPHLPTPVTSLEGAAATSARVRQALQGAAVFHYAGHAKLRGAGGLETELTLADGRMTVADLLATSAAAPPLVVLSGCETARASEVGVEALGLAQAFVLAGSEAVIATDAPLDDARAAAAMECLHAKLAVAEVGEAMRASMFEPGCEALRGYRLFRP